MKDKNSLNKYLLGRFLIALLLIWVLQMFINLAMRSFIIPSMERTLGLEGMLSGKSIGEMLRVFITSLVVVIVRLGVGSSDFIERIVSGDYFINIYGENLADLLLSINSRIDRNNLTLYAINVVLFFVILLIIWSIPYILGGLLYARRVVAKVKELEEARIEREREYERQRNLLLSDITHDIKTPITTIAGFSKALTDGTVATGDEKEYLSTIYNKSMLVSNLVSLLFEYIKLDSKGYTLNKTRFDFAEMLRECVAAFYTEFETKNMELQIDIIEDEAPVFGDKMQLERAINNILSNTIKHNPEGTLVKITLSKDDKELFCQISDKGTRIESEDAKHLFEPFYRGDKSRKTGSGNGLGLSITKKIVDMHGGKIILVQYLNQENSDMVKSFEIKLKLDR